MINSSSPIRVLLVDDSALALTLQKRMLAISPRVEVVGTAPNGREALRLLAELKPDVVCTDYEMPIMNGLELVQNIMATLPCPILVVSSLAKTDEESVSRNELMPLLAAGALDVFPKPNALHDFEPTARAFAEKIHILAGVFVFSRRAAQTFNESNIEYSMSRNAMPRNAMTRKTTIAPSKAQQPAPQKRCEDQIKIVGIGASTGGPQVLQQIFSLLPANFPFPILCVQHISAGFLSGLIEWLDGASRLRAKMMSEGEIARAGTIYFPIEGRHMSIDAQGRLNSSCAPPVDGHRPSVTALFESLAQSYGKNVLAILLTGMGEDGARGLKTIVENGGKTIAQDEASSVVFGMPRKAIELGAAQKVLSTEEIIETLRRDFLK